MWFTFQLEVLQANTQRDRPDDMTDAGRTWTVSWILEAMVTERSVRGRIIIASSSLSDKIQNSNESQSDIIEEVALSLCNLVLLV